MARFAKIDPTSPHYIYNNSPQYNKIITIINVHDDLLVDSEGNRHENLGIEFLKNLYGWSVWKETFKDGSQRKNYASIGGTYDLVRDAFIDKKPYPSWLLDEDTCQWNAPTPYPDDGKKYYWDEDTTSWIEG